MKLFGQHGHGPSDKLVKGLEEGLIDGAILGARYLRPDKAQEQIQELKEASEEAEIMIDPEYCAAAVAGTPNAQLGHLEEWEYFKPLRPTDFLLRPHLVEALVKDCLTEQENLGATHLIAPSVYVSHSLDSREAALSLTFLQKAVASSGQYSLPVVPTLALHANAILKQNEVADFVDTFTGMPERPKHIYLIIGGDSSSGVNGLPPQDFFDFEVLGAWMYVIFALSINGVRVVNGFTDLLSPFHAVAGAYAGATGWWSNLQWFSMDRYIASPGIRKPPLRRYLSIQMLARIAARDRDALLGIRPDIANGLPHDNDYKGDEPDRTAETLQSWEALGRLLEQVDCTDALAGINDLSGIIKTAEKTWASLRERGISRGQEAADEYLTELQQALGRFCEMAEL